MPAIKGRAAPRNTPRTTALRTKAWWVLRKNKELTLADLLSRLVTRDAPYHDPANNLRKWLGKLVAAGIVSRRRIPDEKPTSNGVYLFIIEDELGPKAPIVRKDGVFDPNSGTMYKGGKNA